MNRSNFPYSVRRIRWLNDVDGSAPGEEVAAFRFKSHAIQFVRSWKGGLMVFHQGRGIANKLMIYPPVVIDVEPRGGRIDIAHFPAH
jgi:hypothetical protein